MNDNPINPKIGVFVCEYRKYETEDCVPLDTSHFRVSLQIEPLDTPRPCGGLHVQV